MIVLEAFSYYKTFFKNMTWKFSTKIELWWWKKKNEKEIGYVVRRHTEK